MLKDKLRHIKIFEFLKQYYLCIWLHQALVAACGNFSCSMWTLSLIEEEKIGWHHLLNGHQFEQTPEDSEGQGSLTCCRSWSGRVEHDLVTEQQQLPNKSLYNLSATWSLHYFYCDGVEKLSALEIRLLAFYGCTLFFETHMSPILHLLQPLYMKTILQLIIIDLFTTDTILCFGLFLY